nr:uroporphyrinogen-III C-methyltransferase [Atopomonas sediminilitoris]
MPSAAGLSEQKAALAEVQASQQQFDQRLATLLDRSRQDWRLAEGEHLVRLASLRLASLRDAQGAQALLIAADDILREQDDPAAYAAREQLAKSVEALRMLPKIDRTGLFLQLSALRDHVFSLKPLPSDYDAEAEPPLLSAREGDPEWKQWLSKLSAYVRIDVAAEESIRPLLAGESLEQVQLALSLTLQQAQWSVFNGDPKVYQDALKQAEQIVARYFPLEHGEVRNVQERFKELAAQPVDVPLPSIADTLVAYQLYLAQRERKDLLLTPVEAAAAPAASGEAE